MQYDTKNMECGRRRQHGGSQSGGILLRYSAPCSPLLPRDRIYDNLRYGAKEVACCRGSGSDPQDRIHPQQKETEK